MGVIYGVYRYGGQYEEAYKYLEKCFEDIRDAENYRDHLEAEEKYARDVAKRCRDCGGFDKTCPLWVMPDDLNGECMEYINRAFHDDEYYEISEVEYVEASNGKKAKDY